MSDSSGSKEGPFLRPGKEATSGSGLRGHRAALLVILSSFFLNDVTFQLEVTLAALEDRMQVSRGPEWEQGDHLRSCGTCQEREEDGWAHGGGWEAVRCTSEVDWATLTCGRGASKGAKRGPQAKQFCSPCILQGGAHFAPGLFGL